MPEFASVKTRVVLTCLVAADDVLDVSVLDLLVGFASATVVRADVDRADVVGADVVGESVVGFGMAIINFEINNHAITELLQALWSTIEGISNSIENLYDNQTMIFKGQILFH